MNVYRRQTLRENEEAAEEEEETEVHSVYCMWEHISSFCVKEWNKWLWRFIILCFYSIERAMKIACDVVVEEPYTYLRKKKFHM